VPNTVVFFERFRETKLSLREIKYVSLYSLITFIFNPKQRKDKNLHIQEGGRKIINNQSHHIIKSREIVALDKINTNWHTYETLFTFPFQ